MILEMILWTKPIGLKVFRMTKDKAEQTKIMALNQGLYNGFLVAGLSWSLIAKNNSKELAIFFLTCVLIAGIVGGLSANKKIFYIQGMPALIAILAIYL